MRGSQELNSRRLSNSDYRECTNSFKFTSIPSSPHYTSRDRIDPSTYSFTTALKALQVKARMDENLEIVSRKKGVALNSKWNEAEKYISNPLSGQVPIQCLSSRTLSARFTMSTSIVYPSHPPVIRTTCYGFSRNDHVPHTPNKAKKVEHTITRDIGTQSMPLELISPPLMEEKSKKCSATELVDSPKQNYETEVEVKEENKDKEERKREVDEEGKKESNEGGCLSSKKHKSKKKASVFLVCLPFPCTLI